MLRNQSVRFLKVEFCLITRLRFGVVPDITGYAEVENGIHQWYFPEADEFWLVEDFDAFYAFSWGVHLYKHSIYSFKHVLDGRRDRFERCQHEKGTHVHTVETYNIYGLSHALLIFAFEVIPNLGQEFSTRRVTDLSPGILMWELTKQPRGNKLAKIFKSRATFGGNSGTEGGGFTDRTSDNEGSDPDAGGLRPSDNEGYQTDPHRERNRHGRVCFNTPRHATSTGDFLRGVGRDGEGGGRSEDPPTRGADPESESQSRTSDSKPATHTTVLSDLPAVISGSTQLKLYPPPNTSVQPQRSPPLPSISSSRSGPSSTQHIDPAAAAPSLTQHIDPAAAALFPTQHIKLGSAIPSPTQHINTGSAVPSPTQHVDPSSAVPFPTQHIGLASADPSPNPTPSKKRKLKCGWQLMSPYTDPCRPKRLRT
ncbi:hypothetical protein Ddye_000863 [Dipteronia dyeriana]|uniref:Uncharacterized protein n=1 Tax=Dipteronia dyeriana TaxID=168575 RepID=A0AAE0CT05_9ROSI|nr:hypothetical protein Ddye_000863 [Dipteronia dyeriana]